MIKIKKIRRRFFKDIVVSAEFKSTQPLPQKLIRKTADFLISGNLEKIYIDKDFKLIDGYCSYLIVKELGTDVVGKKLKIRMVWDSKGSEDK